MSIARFRDSGKFDPVPEENGGLPDLYRKSRELAQNWTEKRLHIERTEFNQIKGRSETLSTLLRGKDVKTHFDRIDRCISGIAEQLPSAAADKVQAWKQAFVRMSPKIDDRAGERVECLIIALEEDEIPAKPVKPGLARSSASARP